MKALNPRTETVPRGTAKAMIYGFAVGGGLTACSACCNPALFMALGMATLKGRTIWGAAILAAFALGYSLPLAGAVVGLGFGLGKLSSAMQKFAPKLKFIAGSVLIGVGIYLLATL